MPDRSHKVSACRRQLAALLGVFGLALIAAAPASAQEEILGAASYPDMSTYQCRTDAIPIYPGQNLNLFGLTKTCPNAESRSAAPATPASSPPAPPPRAT